MDYGLSLFQMKDWSIGKMRRLCQPLMRFKGSSDLKLCGLKVKQIVIYTDRQKSATVSMLGL